MRLLPKNQRSLIRMGICFCFLICALPAAAQEADTPVTTEQTDPGAALTPDATITPTAEPSRDNGSEVLCVPAVYQLDPESCNPLGPSDYLTDLADEGLDYPPLPFPGKKIDPTLMDVPYKYAKINLETWENAGFYDSPEAAAAGGTPVSILSSGAIRYLSYDNVVEIDGAAFVHSKDRKMWMRASPAGVSTSTLGRTFTKTPERDFGWIIEACNPYLQPNYYSGYSAESYLREDVVQIYKTIEEKDTVWYQIGDNQWVDTIHIRAAHINTTPPAEIPTGRWIEVDLLQQVVMVYQDYELIYACLVATGMKPYYTQPGIFQIYEKKESEDMTGSFETDKSDYYYLEDVPFTMYFDKLRAFHGAYWRAWYGYEQSHGCVNMSIGDAHWLFNWAENGEWVYVHDPSGKTPTDPEAYQEGGA